MYRVCLCVFVQVKEACRLFLESSYWCLFQGRSKDGRKKLIAWSCCCKSNKSNWDRRWGKQLVYRIYILIKKSKKLPSSSGPFQSINSAVPAALCVCSHCWMFIHALLSLRRRLFLSLRGLYRSLGLFVFLPPLSNVASLLCNGANQLAGESVSTQNVIFSLSVSFPQFPLTR